MTGLESSRGDENAHRLRPEAAAERVSLADPLVTCIIAAHAQPGGADGGTPELYFTDPDGLAIQLQDVTYCGGGGFLGDVCPANPAPNGR